MVSRIGPKGYEVTPLSPSGDAMCTVGRGAREGIEFELRKGDFARSWGELGAGVVNPGVPK
jgi:hypothetical protein